MSVTLDLDKDTYKSLQATLHSTPNGICDVNASYSSRPTLEEAKTILLRHTSVRRDVATGLKHRTVDTYNQLENLWCHMNMNGTFSSGMHLVFWPAGQALVKAIKEKRVPRQFIENKRILGLCSGSGLAEIYIAKHFKPHLIVCSDQDVFSNAMTHLNAELNGIKVGEKLVISKQNRPTLYLTSHNKAYRLYDTLILSDYWYGFGGKGAQEERTLAIHSHALTAMPGATVLAGEVDYIELYKNMYPHQSNYYQRMFAQNGMGGKTVLTSYKMPFNKRALDLDVEPRQEDSGLKRLPVRIHRVSGVPNRVKPKIAMPLLANEWWKSP